jgi:hypothetical protein
MTSRSSLLLFVALLSVSGLILPSALLAGSTSCNSITGIGGLVANCGFETGEFTSWTTIPAASGSDFEVDFLNPHSGIYSARFGATAGLNDYIFQNLATTAGDTYDVNFWVDGSEGANGQFVANWNGSNILTLTGPIAGGYTDYNFLVSATSSITQLEFGGNTLFHFYYLDDISAVPTATPEPSSILLLGTSFLAAAGIMKRKIFS